MPSGKIIMSSSTSSTGTTAVMDHQTYQCTSCNTDISPITRFTCHHCNSIRPPIPNPNNQNPSQSPPQSVINPSVPSTTARRFPSDDNFRLDSPYFQRLIHHLTQSNDSSPITTTTTTTAVSRHHCPTSKLAIESIPIVTITSAFLEIDPIVLCAICKDQFVIDDETKQLPCKHMYHPDCILPWLSNHNSCPVCRFQLPKEVVDARVRRRSRSRVLRFVDLMEEVDDEAMLGLGFSNLHNHQYLEPMDSPNVAFPYTHIGQTVDVDVLPDSELDNGVESLSGWSSWGMNPGGDGDGNVAMPP